MLFLLVLPVLGVVALVYRYLQNLRPVERAHQESARVEPRAWRRGNWSPAARTGASVRDAPLWAEAVASRSAGVAEISSFCCSRVGRYQRSVACRSGLGFVSWRWLGRRVAGTRRPALVAAEETLAFEQGRWTRLTR